MAPITGGGATEPRQPFWPRPPSADHADGYVEAVLCGRGHVNHPRVAFCHGCGLAMGQAAPRMVRAPRPPLGVIVDDQGHAHVLDRDYVIGQPGTGHAVICEADRPLQAQPTGAEPGHATTGVGVHLRGWRIILCLMRGERADTLIAYPPYHHWIPMAAEHAAAVPSDTRLSVAGHVFVIESHWPD